MLHYNRDIAGLLHGVRRINADRRIYSFTEWQVLNTSFVA